MGKGASPKQPTVKAAELLLETQEKVFKSAYKKFQALWVEIDSQLKDKSLAKEALAKLQENMQNISHAYNELASKFEPKAYQSIHTTFMNASKEYDELLKHLNTDETGEHPNILKEVDKDKPTQKPRSSPEDVAKKNNDDILSVLTGNRSKKPRATASSRYSSSVMGP